MFVVGLTGPIGAGKSTVAARLRAQGVPTLDADAVVHALYEGAAAPLVEAAFPGVTSSGIVDRAKLSQALVADPTRFADLEGVVHPLVRIEQGRFLRSVRGDGGDLAVLETPLLFEIGVDERVDAVVLVAAREEMRRARVLARPGMTPEKLERIMSRQAPDESHVAKTDFVVDTNGSLEDTNRQVDHIIASLRGRSGSAYDRFWR